MTTRQVNPNSRRFLRQAIRSIAQGRMFGRGRRNARTVQASTTSASSVSLGAAFTHHVLYWAAQDCAARYAGRRLRHFHDGRNEP
jgi:hypothetical protein